LKTHIQKEQPMFNPSQYPTTNFNIFIS